MSKFKSLDIFFIFYFIIVLSLGTWQIIRLNYKNKQISYLEENLKKNSIKFNLGLDKEYTKVSLNENNLTNKFFLYQLNKGQIGFKVLVPYEIDNTSVVLVDKGWVKKDKISEIKKVSFNKSIVEGYTKKISKKNYFTPDNNNKEDFLYSIEISSLQKFLNKNIYPLLIVQTSRTGKDIIPNDYEVHLSNNHLQYAITWYALAFVTGIFFLYYRKKF